MTNLVTIRHNFETAHRLPHLPGKCQSLHGHSWWAEVTVAAPDLSPAGMVVEFGAFKKELRAWIDQHLDHGAMLGAQDALLPILRAHGSKVYEVTRWPTVEATAELLAHVAGDILFGLDHAYRAYISRVHITETHANGATWEQTDPFEDAS
ncbi:6-carboxytetrahydropterin synthase [Streptomyces sp. SAI-127]|uniref:6-pyruvoyl trahydropterin synthase family protein n=1 Tax=Streptomyces sp. SAI-127 TaxID=2940543 RepID=UPI002472F108|nr:6-carboxytetrahydropterin synthase [Streptomyces sp. SAI-127]MDH6489643.1 6-pyruvoyltetrahydropterin/6-carboxytetrahydropterin synthase [Streptomyces sp. SAI-127]